MKRLGFHSEEMTLALMLWLCSLSLVAVVVIPLFGLRVAAVVALALFGVAMAVCWGLCGGKVYQALTRKGEEALIGFPHGSQIH